MKKTILTFSILISSPLFNTFAVGSDNKIEIAPSPIEQLQNIANDASKSEKERLDACKKLMTSQDINKDKIVNMLLTIAKEFNIYHTTALDVLWNDQETKEKYLDILAPLYFDCAKNTKSENLKTVIFDKLFSDQQCKIKYDDALVSIALDLAENGENPSYIQESLNKLWQDADIKEKYRSVLSKALLLCAQQDKNETSRSNTTHALWNDLATRQTYHEELVNWLLDLARNVESEIIKSTAIGALWSDPATREANRPELLTSYFELFKNAQDETKKAAYLSMLWSDPATKETNKLELVASYLELFRNAQDETKKAEYLSMLWSDPATKETNKLELVASYLELFRNAQDEAKKTLYLSWLWSDPATKEAHRAELVAAYLGLFKNSQDEAKKAQYLLMLWYDPVSKGAHRDELVAAYLELFRNSQDEAKKALYLSMLWHDPATKEAHKEELIAAYLDFFRNTQNETQKAQCISILWNDPTTKEAHRDEFVAAYLELFRNSQDEAKKAQYLSMLWSDPATKEAHKEELIAAYLEFFRNSQDEVMKAQYLSTLWHDPATKEAHKEELIAAYLELFRNSQDEVKKSQYLSLLWSDQNIRANHLHELIVCHIDLVKHASRKSIRDMSFNALNSDQEARQVFNEQHKELFDAAQERMKSEVLQEQKLENYLQDGDIYQEAFQSFITEYWTHLFNEDKAILCQKYVTQFGEDNPRIQELLLLLARDGNARHDTVLVYAELLQKIHEDYKHHPSWITIALPKTNQELHFAINPRIFSYLPVAQDTLATLDDVKAILGVEDVNLDFKVYFTAPFTEEGIMLQAMVQKFKKMGEKGKERLHELMIDMRQCKPGKNQAIWEYYAIESLPLFYANLQHIKNWQKRLEHFQNYNISKKTFFSECKKSPDNLLKLIKNMRKEGHIFRSHLTDLKTEDAEKLKALLGSIANEERLIPANNVQELGKTLLKALKIIAQLSNPDTFYKNLERLCLIHEIYPPANKFGDQLSPRSLDALIQKLKASDVEGRGELALFQNQLQEFVTSDVFLEKLNDFQSEEGAQLRELIGGFVRNGWCVGLLNLMEVVRESGIDLGISAFYKQTTIDKDMPLTWETLKTTLLRELLRIKRETLNALVENVTKLTCAHNPHVMAYAEGLLGGVIGLRNPLKAPRLDSSPTPSNMANLSLQEMLDLFHEELTPITIITHLNQMIIENRLSIIDPMTGLNIIWQMLSLAAKEQLSDKEINSALVDIDELIYNENGTATQLAIALLLTKLGILNEVDENGNPVGDNNFIID